MYESAYDIVASGMRYFFLVLILYILLRLVLHSITEFRAVQQIKKQVRSVSPGYLEVLAPEEKRGEHYPLRRENTLGRGKRCDICIQHPSLALLHAFVYEKKGGLFVADYGSSAGVLLNGVPIHKKEALLFVADELKVGDIVLRVHLAGEEDPEGEYDEE